MKHEFDIRHLDVQVFAKAEQSLSGDTPLRHLPRLAQDTLGSIDDLVVTWQAQGVLVQKVGAASQIWLHLQAQAQVPVRCQRCMQPLFESLQIQRQYRFVRDEETAWQEDEASVEDLLVLTRDFDLLELIEDELIMDLPIVPMHDSCESEWTQTSQEDPLPEAQKPNPFAVLAALKKQSD